MTMFKKATKTQSKLRMALYGVSGSGKTFSSLAIAKGLGGKIAVIDTERGSASKYANRFEFDVLEMQPPFAPANYVAAIKAAENEGYDIIIIDSLTHAWSGTGGALEMVDNAAKRSQSGNSYVAWRDVTPQHNALIDAIVQSKCHIIATMRSKTEYVMEQRGNKTVPVKKALAPIQRDGMEYEFDVVAEMNIENEMIVQKSRCETLAGAVIARPNGQVSDALKAWLTDGAPEMSPEEKAAAELEKRKSGLLAWFDSGKRINANNAADIDAKVADIAKEIGYTFDLEDGHNNPSGRLAALVEHLKAQPQAVIEVAQ